MGARIVGRAVMVVMVVVVVLVGALVVDQDSAQVMVDAAMVAALPPAGRAEVRPCNAADTAILAAYGADRLSLATERERCHDQCERHAPPASPCTNGRHVTSAR